MRQHDNESPGTAQRKLRRRCATLSGVPVRVELSGAEHFCARLTVAREQPYHRVVVRRDLAHLSAHLVAHECLHLIRQIEAGDWRAAAMTADARRRASDRVMSELPPAPPAAREALAGFWATRIVAQASSTPQDIAIEERIHREHPQLRPLQRRVLAVQLEECLAGCSPAVAALSPPGPYRFSLAMSLVFHRRVGMLLGDRSWRGLSDAVGPAARRLAADLEPLLTGRQGFADDLLTSTAWLTSAGYDGWVDWVTAPPFWAVGKNAGNRLNFCPELAI